jgi:hypothetical protein
MRPKEKNLDIWYNINCEIEVNQNKDIHKIKNIKITNQFNYDNKDYKLIISYLELIWLLNKNLKHWLVNPAFFEIIDKVNSHKNIDYTKILLAKLKILHQLWILQEKHCDNIICKILKFVADNNIDKILLLKALNDEVIKNLEQIINSSEHSH